MTATTKRISDIAERLDPERQEILLEIAEDMARRRRFFDLMTPEDQEELERSLREADGGAGLTQEELNRRLDAILAPARK